jgi:hypothetical protein
MRVVVETLHTRSTRVLQLTTAMAAEPATAHFLRRGEEESPDKGVELNGLLMLLDTTEKRVDCVVRGVLRMYAALLQTLPRELRASMALWRRRS